MSDWDPFADPAGTEDADVSPQTNIASKQEKKQTDIVAAICAPPRMPADMTAEQFELLLDDFFSVGGDVDFEIVEDAFRPVGRAIEDNAAFKFPLWKRGATLMAELSEQLSRGEPTPKMNVFGLLVDEFFGFSLDLDNNWPSPVVVDVPPAGEPCGRVILLFAWGGARCSDMDDVVELYRELYPQAVMVRTEGNRFDSWGLRVTIGAAIRAAAWTWKSLKGEAKPQLFVHLFSNSGFFTWEEMLISWQQLSERGTEVPELGMPLPPMSAVLRGLILDSAPDAQPEIVSQIQSLCQSMAGFLRAVVAADNDGSEDGRKNAEMKSRRAVMELIGPFSPVKVYLSQKPGAERQILYMCSARTKKVHQLEPPVPMQFIYSLADAIIRCEGTEHYIDEVEQRPNREGLPPPRRLRFEKTKHALHKVERKDEYMSCVRTFATEVLSSEHGSTE